MKLAAAAPCRLVHNLAEFVTGLRAESVCADLNALFPGRYVDDNAQALLRSTGGSHGKFWSSQVSPGHENARRLRIYGGKVSLKYSREQPDQLRWSPLGEPPRILARGVGQMSPAAAQATGIPAGHPEGCLDAFAQLNRNIAEQVAAMIEGKTPDSATLLVPIFENGIRGIAFVAAGVESRHRGSMWVVPEV